MKLSLEQLIQHGMEEDFAKAHIDKLNKLLENETPETCWRYVLDNIVLEQAKFETHLFLYQSIYPDWENHPCPAWFPSEELLTRCHLAVAIRDQGLDDYQSLHHWSHTDPENFWAYTIKQLGIVFKRKPNTICDLSKGVTNPMWLPGAAFNIANSCFQAAPHEPAIIYQAEDGQQQQISYEGLDSLSNRVANSLYENGFHKSDAIAIDMPMHIEAVAIYLGIIKAGCIAVTIAESFSTAEIQKRLDIGNCKAIFTQDRMARAGKHLPIYAKVIEAKAPMAIVLCAEESLSVKLRDEDLSFQDFLSENTEFESISCKASDYATLLFSSGTTGTPKAIPWTHTTPIKSASDAYYHHNIEAGDRICWPTSLGWMMGPWLVFASLINKATIMLYGGIPTSLQFGEFIADNDVTMLGLVPSLVKAWRASGCMESLNWSEIKCFSSTGECSNIEDMLYLMMLGYYCPIIEYCGGTETGGGYITSTLIQNNAPSSFTTPAMGLDFVILDERGKLTDDGEVALIPPSIGLSTQLLNRDHDTIYYQDMPIIHDRQTRRHGDHIKRFDGYYRAMGRTDDTMNLGGIKTSAIEIERVLESLEPINEAAAIAITPHNGGPSDLVIYVVVNQSDTCDVKQLQSLMQSAIKEHLNPLFKISDVVIIDALPRTASNKIMRRTLRDRYNQHEQ